MMRARLERLTERLAAVRLGPSAVQQRLARASERLAATRLTPALVTRPLAERTTRLAALERLRLQLDPKAPLKRGYALVCSPGHPVVTSRALAEQQPVLTLEFADGTMQVATGDAPPSPRSPRNPAAKPAGPTPSDAQPKLL